MVMKRFDPYTEARQMEDALNRLWRGLGSRPSPAEGAEDWNILIDVTLQGDEISVVASLPGVPPEGIDVAVEDNILTLHAHSRAEVEDDKVRYLIRERPTGSFFRALRLPQNVDTNKIQSHYESGVLTITMPKAEEKKKKQIKVSVGGIGKVIEGTKK